MDDFGAVRELARKKHDEMKAASSGSCAAKDLLAQARSATGASVHIVDPAHPMLAGGDGALHGAGSTPSIYISNALPPEQAAAVEAHEFGHFWIETPDDPAVLPRGWDPSLPEENTPLGLRRVEAYSPEELRERHANVFAREFLLPCAEARRLFLLGKSATQIAAEVGAPLGLVNQQLAVALLLPQVERAPETESREQPGLDDSQQKAAEHEGSPLLVEAGPGTGKTRTLIARIEFLLGKGVPAPSILVLTFSNKAAREIRERVARSAPLAAPEIWAGTFHSFGLEVLRKYGDLADIKHPVKLLDQADQLALLERELPHLGLDHYLLLHEPLLQLRHIIGAISRAKDEVFGPEEYAASAATMLSAATGDAEKVLKAEKAAEVASVYAHYEACLRDEGVVDFADLINRPIEILRAHPDARAELRGQYTHILVDEYQDVNRASALLLKELAGDGGELWVVGDARQSIYRFRGAAPSNTVNFEKDYPEGKRLPLRVNYRSRKQIVDAFGAYAGTMRVGGGRILSLEAARGPGAGPIEMNVASDRACEIGGIAAAVERARSDGIPYRDQAVLCRTHGNLQKIAAGLEAAGIPTLYLGDLFERPEVRDLLSIISFAAERRKGGLLRVATMPRWAAPLADVRALLAYADEVDAMPALALTHPAAMSGISPVGLRSFTRLEEDLVGTNYKTGPGRFLCHLLFECGLVRDYLSGGAAADHQRRLAIHQFLQFAIECDVDGEGDPKQRMLDWVRRLELFGDERALREPPAAIDGINAVRLMTVHASKGLEFRVVHLPVLGTGKFPLKWNGKVCPAPDGMLEIPAQIGHQEEEECLFFVALSRARDRLSLSRALRYSDSQASNPSPALDAIASHLSRSPDSVATWKNAIQMPPEDNERPDLKCSLREHEGLDLELYTRCPRKYLYQKVLGLHGSREDNGYVLFHRVLYRMLGWMAKQPGPLTGRVLQAEADGRWAEAGLDDHPLHPIYRTVAQRILDQANARPRAGMQFAETLSIAVGQHKINVSVDELEGVPAGFIIRRLRTGKAPGKPDHRMLHALMMEAGRAAHGGGGKFEIRYMSSDVAVPISFARVMADRLAEAKGVLTGLEAGRYPAKASEDCPRCPHYFICPSVPN